MTFEETKKIKQLKFSIISGLVLLTLAIITIITNNTTPMLFFLPIIAILVGIVGSNIIYVIQIYKNSFRNLIIKKLDMLRDETQGFQDDSYTKLTWRELKFKDIDVKEVEYSNLRDAELLDFYNLVLLWYYKQH